MKSIHTALVVAIIFKATGMVLVSASYPILALAIAINTFVFLVIEVIKQVFKQVYIQLDK